MADTTAKRVVAVLPTRKRTEFQNKTIQYLNELFTFSCNALVEVMKDAARNSKNAVCRIKGDQLLVRFKEQSPILPEAVIQQEEYTEAERRVSI